MLGHAPEQIDFYFDLASPFAYMAFQRIAKLAEKHGRMVRYRAIDLAEVKKAAGNTGPSNRDIPPKFAYLKQDLARWAALYGVPFAFPTPGQTPPPGARDSQTAQRGFFFADRQGKGREYVAAFWRRSWGGGRFIGDPEVLVEAVTETGLPEKAFFAFVVSDEAGALYEAATEEARERGVFGVPTMICDGEMWWGNDRLELLDRYLSGQRPGPATSAPAA